MLNQFSRASQFCLFAKFRSKHHTGFSCMKHSFGTFQSTVFQKSFSNINVLEVMVGVVLRCHTLIPKIIQRCILWHKTTIMVEPLELGNKQEGEQLLFQNIRSRGWPSKQTQNLFFLSSHSAFNENAPLSIIFLIFVLFRGW